MVFDLVVATQAVQGDGNAAHPVAFEVVVALLVIDMRTDTAVPVTVDNKVEVLGARLDGGADPHVGDAPVASEYLVLVDLGDLFLFFGQIRVDDEVMDDPAFAEIIVPFQLGVIPI